MGDASTRAAMTNLRSAMTGTVESGTYKMLSQIGISAKLDGSLSIDSTKLAEALATDGGSVQKLFASSGGLIEQLNATLKAYTADDGQIDVRLDVLNDQLDKIADERTALDTRMDKQEERYRKQFSSLDAIVSKYNNVASYLDQMDNERYKLKS